MAARRPAGRAPLAEPGQEPAAEARTPPGAATVEWLETLTRLTGSIEHEVNQPLAAAVMNAQVALRWLTAEPPDVEAARRAIQHAIGNSRRAADVVRSIRSLARHDASAMAAVDVNRLVRDLLDLLHLELRRHRVEVETRLAQDLEPVWADRGQLEQVLANLVTNAIQAMSTAREQPRRLRIRTGFHSRGAVLVAVEDFGNGIAEPDRARIFDPFFTTKRGGTGLGLTVCRSIVEAHGGRLWASPNSPRGCIMSFVVPTPPRQRGAGE